MGMPALSMAELVLQATRHILPGCMVLTQHCQLCHRLCLQPHIRLRD